MYLLSDLLLLQYQHIFKSNSIIRQIKITIIVGID